MGKKTGAVGSVHLELFPFVVLAICVLSLMAMAGGISEHMLTSWSSFSRTSLIFISWPKQLSQRAFVLPLTAGLALASACTNVKIFVKVFKTSLFPNLITNLIHFLYDYTYWSKILHSAIPHHPRSCQDQGHRLRIFMLKFYVKVFSTSLIFH